MDKPLSERLPEEIFNRVHQDIGEASTCWTDLDGAGTFESERAAVISFNLCHYIADHLDIKDARIAELESITYCAYCGKEYKVDDDAYEVGEHIQTCEKHPLSKANKRIAELEAMIDDIASLSHV